MPVDWPEWMKPMDVRILEVLERTKSAKIGGLWLKGATIAKNLNASSDYVGNRLRQLQTEDYVEADGGYYRITEKGSLFVRDD